MKLGVAWESGRAVLQASRTPPALVPHLQSPFHFQVQPQEEVYI